MLETNEHLRAFAMGGGGHVRHLVELYSNSYADAVRDAVVKRLADYGKDGITASGVDAALSTLSTRGWSPEFALALNAVQRGATCEAVLQLALAVASIGNEVDVQLSLECGPCLFFDGYLIDVRGKVSISSDGQRVVIHMDCEPQPLVFVRHHIGWRREKPSAPCGSLIWEPQRDVAGDDDLYFISLPIRLSADSAFGSVYATFDREGERAPLPLAREEGQAIMEARRFADRYAPQQAEWSRWVSRGVLSYPPANADVAESSSSFSRPGLIYLAHGASVIRTAEMLVHEAAHQYLLLYGVFDQLINDSDGKQYYSSIKGCARDISRILFAAHAIGNMLLYYFELHTNGIDLSTEFGIVRRYAAWFDEMRSDLSNSPGLTSSGRALFDMLAVAVEGTDFSWATGK